MSEWETILGGGRKARVVKPGQGSLSAQLRHMADNFDDRDKKLGEILVETGALPRPQWPLRRLLW